MTLREKQSLFASLIPKLIDFIYAGGYEVTLGDAYRDPRVMFPYGRKNGAHTIRLAIDLNLFLDGIWLRDTDDHLPFGEYWESLHPLCRWGGRFNDGNHYSMEHGGAI